LDSSYAHHVGHEVTTITDEDGRYGCQVARDPPHRQAQNSNDENQGQQGVQEAAVPKEAIEVLGDSTKPISEPALGIVGIGDE
jgi:hypothetical protein